MGTLHVRPSSNRSHLLADTLAVLFATTALIAAVMAFGIIADAIPSWAFALSLLGVFACGLVILWRLPL